MSTKPKTEPTQEPANVLIEKNAMLAEAIELWGMVTDTAVSSCNGEISMKQMRERTEKFRLRLVEIMNGNVLTNQN